MAESALSWFISMTFIFFVLSIFTPFVQMSLQDDVTTTDNNFLSSTFNGSMYLTLPLNLLTMFFWTFGLPAWFNLYVLSFLRIIALLSAYYVIFPTK